MRGGPHAFGRTDMSDLDEPLRPFNERRRGLDMTFKRRAPAVVLLGIVLVALGAAGSWWFSREMPAPPQATVALDRGSVTAGIGEAVDKRSPRPLPRIDEEFEDRAGDVVVLDREPAPLETFREIKPPEDDHSAYLPRPELLEDAPQGPLPRIADGVTPFEAYRVRKSVVAPARVAIVIGGLGLSQTGTKRAIERLPADVTLAFSPDGNSLRRWTEAARKAGHETLLQVPLEPIGWPDVRPSERTLTRDDPSPDALAASLGRVTTYPAVMNYLGTAFSLDGDALETMMRELGARGLGYLDDGRSQASLAPDVARRVGLPFARGSVLLDEDRGAAAVDRALERLVEEARNSGWAIASGTAFPTTVERVALFAEAARGKGIEIVPVSNLMRAAR